MKLEIYAVPGSDFQDIFISGALKALEESLVHSLGSYNKATIIQTRFVQSDEVQPIYKV